jgi:hypothetical protein
MPASSVARATIVRSTVSEVERRTHCLPDLAHRLQFIHRIA